ncbi:tetratricopeptide repeat protein [Croceitalea marina]|uniref:Tetratricopeptide repeat protein n=1 Tax=Croceitalea marina TaxID=1775166 RepID=A0ABW5MYM1_9FLAO
MTKKILFLVITFSLIHLCHGQNNKEKIPEIYNNIESYIYGANQKKSKSKEFYNKLLELSKNEDDMAYYYLGLLQKKGIGKKANLKKSLKSFKKSFELGNKDAAYAIGYYYLKGLGNVQQDYKKAYKWFNKSKSPMAQHWLGKMYFFGFGEKVNKQKAIQLLKNNQLLNSQVLVKQFEKNKESELELPKNLNAFIKDKKIQSMYDLKNYDRIPIHSELEGEWEGNLIELDWSKEKIIKINPVEFSFTKETNINNRLNVKTIINDSIAYAPGTYNSGLLDLNRLTLSIRKKYTDYENFSHLKVQLNSLEIRKITLNGHDYLLGRVNNYIPLWNEKGRPMIILLKKKDKDWDNAQSAFKEQAADFIRLYPNGFENYFLINFDLPEDSKVKVEILNHYGTPNYQKVFYNGMKTTGNHTLEINNPPSEKGQYVVSVTANGHTENKIIIKN